MQHITYLQSAWMSVTSPFAMIYIVPFLLALVVVMLLCRRFATGPEKSISVASFLFCSFLAFLGFCVVCYSPVLKTCAVLNSPGCSILKVQSVDGHLRVVVGTPFSVTASDKPLQILGQSVIVQNIKSGSEISLDEREIKVLSRMNFKLAGVPLDQAVKVAAAK